MSASLHTPRGLSLAQAAAYIGVPIATFEQLVRDRRMPAPKDILGHLVWDRLSLDDAFGKLPDAWPATEVPAAGTVAAKRSRPETIRDDPTKPFTPATLADRWKCSQRAIYTMIASNRLAHFKLGARLVRIPASEVYRCEANPDSLPPSNHR